MTDDDIVVPDKIAPEIGWRAWKIGVNPGLGLRLFSVVIRHSPWRPGDRVEARCVGQAQDFHATPREDCECGLYASNDVGDIQKWTNHVLRGDGEPAAVWRAFGSVRLWGKVIPGTTGWRAQYAYPDRIYVPRWHRNGLTNIYPERPVAEIARELGVYRVPVEVIDSLQVLVTRIKLRELQA